MRSSHSDMNELLKHHNAWRIPAVLSILPTVHQASILHYAHSHICTRLVTRSIQHTHSKKPSQDLCSLAVAQCQTVKLISAPR